MDIFSPLTNTSQNSLIPQRESNAMTGSDFIKLNKNLVGPTREAHILEEFLHGNIPNFLKNFTAITVADTSNSITYLVMTDYLAIGSDTDYVRMPMNPHTAQTIADKYDCVLPTKKMVDDIWKASKIKLAPLPWGPPYDQSMMSTERIGLHNGKVQNQLHGMDNTSLISGHKKDVVLTNKLSPNNPNKKVAIYGWKQLNGQPIQGLNAKDHADLYADYSHGIRLIAKTIFVNSNLMKISDVFADNKLSSLISDEGILTFTRY